MLDQLDKLLQWKDWLGKEGERSGYSLPGLQKDFDTVSHKILTDKLLMYGLNKQTVRWGETWLNGWAQRCKV